MKERCEIICIAERDITKFPKTQYTDEVIFEKTN